MRQVKKSPRKQLEKFSTIFTQLGLVLALFIVFISLEHKTEQKKETAYIFTEPIGESMVLDMNDIPIFVKEEIKIERTVPKQQQKIIVLEKITKVDNKHKETIIDTKPKEVIIKASDIIEIETVEVIEEKDDPKPMIMNLVSKIPVFKGCENLSEIEGRKCLDKNMKKTVMRHFDINLASDLGLKSGQHKIFTQFVIDKEGKVTGIKVNTKNKTLEKEAKRVVNKIPDFTAGESNGKKVSVKYTLPITFQVE